MQWLKKLVKAVVGYVTWKKIEASAEKAIEERLGK